MFSKLAVSTLMLLAASVAGQSGSDYLDVVPPTVYEATDLSPQNMDFDMENNMFIAHSGWYNDKLVHYYKFRIFAPGTYPGVIAPGGSSAQVPLQRIFFVTTTGDFDGVVGMPIIEFHTSDGLTYSDFMNVVFVDAPEGYVADTFQSVADIEASAATTTDTEIVLNIPVVPTGSSLQDPHEKGTAKAPIAPSMVLYRGQEVQTFVFEVTDASAATYFADTRDSSTAVSPQVRLTTGFEIPIVNFAAADFVSAIPLWHVNQFSTGVMEGMGGGPNPAGMRNVINLDRTDAGYSPLWNILWGVEMPVNYYADQFSNSAQVVDGSGLEFFTTPMYVNCPDIGLVGDMNTLKATTAFQTDIIQGCESSTLIGSAPVLIFANEETVMFVAKPSGDTVAETMTNVMGGYEHTIPSSDIPDGTTEIVVMHNGESLRTIPVDLSADCPEMMDMGSGGSAATSASFLGVAATMAAAAMITMV